MAVPGMLRRKAEQERLSSSTSLYPVSRCHTWWQISLFSSQHSKDTRFQTVFVKLLLLTLKVTEWVI